VSAFVLEWNRYLGVPLISGKLNDVDSMLLLEKNKKIISRLQHSVTKLEYITVHFLRA